MSPGKALFNVSLTLTIKEKLTYDDSEKLAVELREQYLGKEADLNLNSIQTGHQRP